MRVDVGDAATIGSVASTPVKEEKNWKRTAFMLEGRVLRHIAACLAVLWQMRKQCLSRYSYMQILTGKA